jgi:hypothetical protein
MGDSVAVQVGLPENPETVNTAGVASEALRDAGLAEPEAQERDTVTLAPLSGTKFLLTVKVAVVVLVMVQEPARRAAAQVPGGDPLAV